MHARFSKSLTTLVFALLVVGSSLHSPSTFAAASDSGARWVATGELNVARTYHTATLLADGRVLVVGGTGSDGSILDSAELYDPATRTWKTTGKLALGRTGHAAIRLQNGRVLIVEARKTYSEVYNPATGSWSVISHSADAEVYDPATGSWSPTGSLVANRDQYFTASLLPNGKVLVVGGLDGGEILQSAELYDPMTGTWSLAARPNQPRASHTATVLPNGKVLILGGITRWWDADIEFAPENQAELYDPGTDTWSTIGAPMIVYDHAATLLPNGIVLIADGSNIKRCRPEGCLTFTGRSAVLFDPNSGAWSYIDSSKRAHGGPTATLMRSGQVLLVGAVYASFDAPDFADAQLPDSAAEIFDPGTDAWTLIANPGNPRTRHTATLLNDGSVLIAGGYGAGTNVALASAEIYGSTGPTTPSAGVIGAGLTGSWYDPAKSGHGFSLQVLAGPPVQMLAYWFTFTSQGDQSWIAALGPFDGNRAVLQGVQTVGTGARFPPNFDAANARQESWGTLTFTFRDCNHGHVDWNATAPGYGSGGMDLTRLTLPAGLTCSP